MIAVCPNGLMAVSYPADFKKAASNLSNYVFSMDEIDSNIISVEDLRKIIGF